ncbi:ArsA family ATPase [Nakamurella antarctica]|uniref:ArsA family ATPase n=1 Tax=Nakamurella antarctica TaxID=1902245 RepID=A0A3G8ZVU8_9ACTN|nr:ArsA family ATPase [Nakamurella antarctica]AZI57791.1 ArsA family ATPase [Nakamurella antarctica]
MSYPQVRTALFTGKGGVGKTTLAAAAAVRYSCDGFRTLIISTDLAHSLGDVLGMRLGAEPQQIPEIASGSLYATEVDTQRRFEDAWAGIRDYLVSVLAAGGLSEVAAEELVALPGAAEIIALLEVEKHARSGDFDVIVVDCAPTGETLALLALPETLAFYSERLFSAPQRLLRSLAAGFAGRGNARNLTSGEQVRDALGEVLRRLAEARLVLTQPRSGVVLVSTAERVVIAESRRALTALSLQGFRVSSVVLNRLVPAAADGEWAARMLQIQESRVEEAGQSFSHLAMFRADLRAHEPVGVPALVELAASTFAGVDPLGESTEVAPTHEFEVAGVGGVYTLTVNVPLADRGAIGLLRSGDDIVVSVGSHKRRIALPSLLQRCKTTRATVNQGQLTIEFVPDPDRWPAALKASL